MLCGLESPVMSEQNAASWGYYDCVSSQWNSALLAEGGFPVHLLPLVVPAGGVAGTLHQAWLGIPEGTPVGERSFESTSV